MNPKVGDLRLTKVQFLFAEYNEDVYEMVWSTRMHVFIGEHVVVLESRPTGGGHDAALRVLSSSGCTGWVWLTHTAGVP